MLVRAQPIIAVKKAETKGHEPMALRMRWAARSPRVGFAPDRTPGWACQLPSRTTFSAKPHRDIAVAARTTPDLEVRLKIGAPRDWGASVLGLDREHLMDLKVVVVEIDG